MRLLLPFIFLLIGFTVSAQTINISGRVYYDVNGNHVFDGVDSVLANKQVVAYKNRLALTAGVTDNAGLYHVTLDTGTYTLGLNAIISQDYKDFSQPAKIYTSPTTEIIDFSYQQRDSVESISCTIKPDNNDFTIPVSGGSFNYTLNYGYQGSLHTIPATVTVNYNPKISLLNVSPAPSFTSGGKLQWNLPAVQSFSSADIKLTFRYPASGDTVDHYSLSPKFIPGVITSAYINKNMYDFTGSFNFGEHAAIGVTSGVKWLRHFAPISNTYQPYNDECLSIDTTQNDDGYFIAGYRGYKQDGNYSLPFIAKLNKDGLSVWEKYVDSAGGKSFFDGITTIKHTGDGGCLLLGTNFLHLFSLSGPNVDGPFVAKFDAAGNLVWSKAIHGSANEDYGNDMVVLPDGSCLITGRTESHDGDFAHTTGDTTNFSVFVTKLSPGGNIIFTKFYGGSEYDEGYRFVALTNGSFLLLAATQSTDGDVVGAHTHSIKSVEGGFISYNDEAWILNIDASGNIIWSKCFGGSKSSFFVAAAENNGGILLTGGTDSKDGDLPYYPESMTSLWALQISMTGNILWSKPYKLYKGYQDSNFISSPIPDYYNNSLLSTLHKTKDGNFVLGGTVTDKYGTLKSKHGDADFLLMKINTTGDIIWQKAVGGTRFDQLNDIQLDNNDDIVFVGTSASDNDDLYQHPTDHKLMVVGKIGITNIIKGQVYIDNNNNHIKDAGEHYYSQGRINSTKNADTIAARIFDGSFLSNVDTGSYVSTYKPINNYYTTFPATHTSSFITFDLKDSFDIALTPKPNIPDLEVQLLPLSTARPGFDATYRIITKNVGTTVINNAVIVFKKDVRQTYQTSSRPYNGIRADSIWWGPVTLNPFDIDTLYVTLTLATPPTLNNGDTLTETAIAYPVLNDSSRANNVFSLQENVRGSFDPNDKTEIHAGTLTTTQYANAEYLQYIVRFQNTGTDTAFFITVKDTLLNKVDLSTLEVVSASHPYTFRLNGNVATWDFKNIKLPDNSTDEASSHGFILFKVKPKTGLVVGDEFANKAAIYFDYNLPVITNQEKTMIGTKAGNCPGADVTFAAGLTGSTYQWQINTGAGFTNIANAGIYSGATTATLKLAAPPTTMHGYRYRCVVNGNTNSPENKLKFTVQWKGSTSNAWENAANWNCGVVPDANTEIVIPAGPIYPLVSSNTTCYSLRLSQGSTVTVKAGFKLIIAGKSN